MTSSNSGEHTHPCAHMHTHTHTEGEREREREREREGGTDLDEISKEPAQECFVNPECVISVMPTHKQICLLILVSTLIDIVHSLALTLICV